MKHKIIQLLILTGLLAQTAHSQTDSADKRHPLRHLVEVNILFGGQFHNFSGLNDQLQKANIGKLNSAMSNLGFGVAFNLRHITPGVEASFMQGYQHDISAIGSNARIYLFTGVINAEKWTLGPEIGISWQSIKVQVTKPSTAADFNDALTNAPNQVELQHNNTMLDLALAFKLHASGGSRFRPGLAFKTGYRLGLGDNKWDVRRSAVTDGPKDKASNFYLEMALNFGR